MQNNKKSKSGYAGKYRGYVRGVKWIVAWDRDADGNEACLPHMVTHRVNIFSDAKTWRSPSKRENMFEEAKRRLIKRGHYLSDIAATNAVYKVVVTELNELAEKVKRGEACRAEVAYKLSTLGALLREANEERDMRNYTANTVKDLPDVIPCGDTKYTISNGVYTESPGIDYNPFNEIVVFCVSPVKMTKDPTKKPSKKSGKKATK